MARGDTSLNILFIGNSFTARNDVPGLIASLAAARGLKLEHRLISQGGASLKMHWNKGIAPAAIRQGGWDWVVLQEQSTLPIKSPARYYENVRLFAGPVRDAGAKLALYLTWARRHAPETQEKLTAATTAIAGEVGATVVPAGLAWERFLRTHEHPALHDKDGSHPTLAGSYLAACVFFAVLCGQSPEGIEAEVKGLQRAEATLLQRIAAQTWEAVGSSARGTKPRRS